MKPYRVAFFGHRDVEWSRHVDEALEALILRLQRQQPYIEYWVGRHGDFDQFATSAIRRVHKRIGWDRAVLVLVLPYMTAEFRDNQEAFLRYYGEVRIAESSSAVHPKGAIRARNLKMVEQADLVVCFVTREEGGAYTAVSHARRIGKPVWNLADDGKRA